MLSRVASDPASTFFMRYAHGLVSKTIGHRPSSLASRSAQRELRRLQVGGLDEPLALERLPAAQAVERGRIDDVETGAPEQALGHAGQHLAIVAALRTHVACRTTRKVDETLARRSACAPSARSAPGAQVPATTWAIARPTRGAAPSRPAFMVDVPTRPCIRSAAPSPTRMPAVTPANCFAATPATRLDSGLARRPRKALMSRPVSMLDRAHRRAQSAGGAGLDAVVVVQRLHLGQALRIAAVGLEARDLAPADDALARRKREPARRALGFAEAALDALVDQRICGRQRLQILQVRESGRRSGSPRG